MTIIVIMTTIMLSITSLSQLGSSSFQLDSSLSPFGCLVTPLLLRQTDNLFYSPLLFFSSTTSTRVASVVSSNIKCKMWLPYLAVFKCSLVSQWIVVTERNRIVNIGALLTQIWECQSETWRRNDSHCFRLDCSALAIIIIVIIIIIIILIILEIHPLDKYTSFAQV